MKKFKVVSIIVIVVIILILCGVFLFYKNSAKPKIKEEVKHPNAPITSSTVLSLPKPLFTKEQQNEYYKISTTVGDIGLPSYSLVTNLDNYKTIDGVKYFDAYSYATRTSFKEPIVREDSYNNFSGEIKEDKMAGLNGKKLQSQNNIKPSEDITNLTNEEKYVQLYKIASEYIEGYTANYPNMQVEANDNYEGNLNDITDLKIDLNDTKVIDGHTTYKVIVSINNFNTPIYVGVDGYIFVQSQKDYEQLFFPGWLTKSVPIKKI